MCMRFRGRVVSSRDSSQWKRSQPVGGRQQTADILQTTGRRDGCDVQLYTAGYFIPAAAAAAAAV